MHCIKKSQFSQWKFIWFYESSREIERKHFNKLFLTILQYLNKELTDENLILVEFFQTTQHKMVFAALPFQFPYVFALVPYTNRTHTRQLIQNNTQVKQIYEWNKCCAIESTHERMNNVYSYDSFWKKKTNNTHTQLYNIHVRKQMCDINKKLHVQYVYLLFFFHIKCMGMHVSRRKKKFTVLTPKIFWSILRKIITYFR